MQNLTPPPSVDNALLVVLLPAELMKDALGSLAQLAYSETWQLFDELTPDEAANAFLDAIALFGVEYGVLLTAGDEILTLQDGKLILTIGS